MRLNLGDEETRQAAEALAAGTLDSKTTEVRGRRIPWENLHKAGLLDEKELKALRKYDNSNPKEKTQMLSQNGREYASLFLGLIGQLKQDEILEYSLTLLLDAFSLDESLSGLMHVVSGSSMSHYNLFITMLCKDISNSYITNKAIKITTILLSSGPLLTPQLSQSFFEWLTSKVHAGEPDIILVVMECLMSVLRKDTYRLSFYNCNGSVDGLSDLLTKRTPNFQTQYQVVMCYWLLTYNEGIASTIATRYHIIRVIAQILPKTSKEKVVRVSVATLRNLLEKPTTKTDNGNLMITNELLRQCRSLVEKNWKDADIVTDLEYIIEELDILVENMSSWDEYFTEVKTGELRWSAVHKSEGFWRENVMKFNDNAHEVVDLLINNLSSSSNIVVAVAIHDLGEYVRHYHHGRNYIEDVGGKRQIIMYMEHEDSSVRYEALLAVQKMMVNNWTFLNKK